MEHLYDLLIEKQKLEGLEGIDMSPKRIRAIRALYGLRRQPFADLIKVKFNTYRSWEDGYRFPSSPGLAILLVAEKNPDVFLKNKDEIIKEINKIYG